MNRKNEEVNTFGNYQFEEWVPENERESIRAFWGWAGRTYKDWLANNKCQENEPFFGSNGFGNPPNGARAIYYVTDYEASDLPEKRLYKKVRGRYLHAWNNMGRLIEDNGKVHCVSSCDNWTIQWENK